MPADELPDPDDLVPFVRGGFDRGADDEAWDYLNIDGKYDRVDVPTFHVGGWYDCFIGETLRQYEAMKERAAESGRNLRACWSGRGRTGTSGARSGTSTSGSGATAFS